jgi:taurine dioxygenase
MTLTAAAHPLLDAGWQIEPVAGLVGSCVTGASLLDPLADEQVTALRALIADSGVVVFPRQNLDEAGHVRLARLLGTPKPPPEYIPSLADAGYPEISVISTANGLAYTSDRWHSDVTWMPNPPQYSILHMRQRPLAGGDTMWSSQVVAYERLSDPLRTMLTGLTAVHRLPNGSGISAIHPIVVEHPLTCRRALFINSVFTERVCELNERESAVLLGFLFEHTTQPEWTCRWQWSEGDVAMWDNHFVQHYAINDYGSAPRTINRIETDGPRPLSA